METTVPVLVGLKPWEDNALFWIGPLAGALIAGWLYHGWILPAEDQQVATVPKTTAGSTSAAGGSSLIKARK